MSAITTKFVEEHNLKEVSKVSLEELSRYTGRIKKNSPSLFADILSDFWLYSSDSWQFKGDFMARIDADRNSFLPYESECRFVNSI